MSDEHYEEQLGDIRHCYDCVHRMIGFRCHRCEPVMAPDRDAFLAEWAIQDAAERLLRVHTWIEGTSSMVLLHLPLEETSPAEVGFLARRLGQFVRLAGDGDMERGVDRLERLTMAQRMVA
jgi:hypothetical protein